MFGKFGKNNNLGSGCEFIVVGLGNPGREYENTRHNMGFIAIDKLAEIYGCKINKLKFKSLIGICSIDGKKVLLMKPQTYMNNSGQAVVEAMQFYKIPAENVLIIFDDISLDVGKMRIRRKGSDGGQKGMRSIIYLSGQDTFPRIKMGIGAKPNPNWDLADWVLSSFSSDEQKILAEKTKDAAEASRLIINGKIAEAMNKYN